MAFQPAPSELYFKSPNSNDPRLGEHCQKGWPHAEASFILAGYPDDDGIQLNNGRPGAKEGPNAIRKSFYKMTPKYDLGYSLFDIGNLDQNIALEQRHKEAQKKAKQAFEEGHCWLSLGGGHDYGYPDSAAFLEAFEGQDPLVINFDAHLDVRPTDNGLSSGTPFYRLLNDYKNFSFIEVGIQQQCNSKNHFNWCEERKVEILNYEDYLYSHQTFCNYFEERFEGLLNINAEKKRPCFLSIDIDGFSSGFAMGCSQSWPAGIEPSEFFPWLKLLVDQFDVRGLGIYEVSPPLDQDHRTAKLAAQILHHFIFYGR